MPETPFTVTLPDGSFHACYSPSSVVKQYFEKGQEIPAGEFLTLAREALNEASERVRQKFGFACTGASASLADIERWAGNLPPDTPLTISHI
ncbi:MAG: MSMEG_0570 family nitrogen starvation response protein [Verrucomicrobiales bacterium]|nr:MSMEG_0570 family nitrogen starvation response protein [Verrucomicrobiales bacterium]